jgi:hypothetical protein
MTGTKTTITVEDCLKGAFQALLRGDTADRDRLCAMAEKAMRGKPCVPGNTPVAGGEAIDVEFEEV